VDEQNIKGVHPQFYQPKQTVGNSWGAFKQNQVFVEFLFSHSLFMVKEIDKMAEVSKQRKIVDKNAPVGAATLTLWPTTPGAAEQHQNIAAGLAEGANPRPWGVDHVSEGYADSAGGDADRVTLGLLALMNLMQFLLPMPVHGTRTICLL
jgi:hypothetical protein